MTTTKAPVEVWGLLRSGAGAAAANMALDEALLLHLPRLGFPVLRFYGWTEQAATFGYFQAHASIAAAVALRPLVRRPTGGGIVCHDADWTYSLFFPPRHGWYALTARESYRRVHEWVAEAFVRLRYDARLATERRSGPPIHCFAEPEQFDVIDGEGKLAGAAQRRNRFGLLIQGSVRPPAGLVRAHWEEAMCRVGAEKQSIKWDAFEPAAEVLRARDELIAKKYGRREYNEKR